MDIEKLSIQDLKALAYDQLVLLQQTQNNIRLLEEKIKEKEAQNGTTKEETAK